MNRGKGHWQGCHGSVQHGQDSRHVARKQELDCVLDVTVHIPSIGNSLDDGCKVVICQDHGSRILGNLGSRDTHGNADVRLLKGRRIIDTVSCHGCDGSPSLPCVHDADLILR